MPDLPVPAFDAGAAPARAASAIGGWLAQLPGGATALTATELGGYSSRAYRFGWRIVVLFSDRVERFVPAKKGRKHILRIVDELLAYEPRSRKSNLDPALNFLSSSLKHGSVIIFAPGTGR